VRLGEWQVRISEIGDRLSGQTVGSPIQHRGGETGGQQDNDGSDNLNEAAANSLVLMPSAQFLQYVG